MTVALMCAVQIIADELLTILNATCRIVSPENSVFRNQATRQFD